MTQELTLIEPEYVNATKGDIRSNVFTKQITKDDDMSSTIVVGGGGTDLLNLSGFGNNFEGTTNVFFADVYLNGSKDLNFDRDGVDSELVLPVDYDPTDTSGMAIYGGTSFDVLTVNFEYGATHEFYLHGIEEIQLPGYDGNKIYLSEDQTNVQKSEWNLQVMDVPLAWRFGKGANSTILVSLDQGLVDGGDPEIPGAINKNPEIPVQPWVEDYYHRVAAMSVMAGKTVGVAPKNTLWAYNVYQIDYGKGHYTLGQAIHDVMDTNFTLGKNVVFQTGVQGKSWWYDNPNRSKEDTLSTFYGTE